MAISFSRAGTDERNRTYSPSFCARLPISGLRNSALKGPVSAARLLASRSFTIACCSGVNSAEVSGLNRSPRRFKSRIWNPVTRAVWTSSTTAATMSFDMRHSTVLAVAFAMLFAFSPVSAQGDGEVHVLWPPITQME